MPAPGDHVPRVPRTTVKVIGELTHLQQVCEEEGIVMPAKVIHAVAVLRVWCRDVGKQHQPGGPEPS